MIDSSSYLPPACLLTFLIFLFLLPPFFTAILPEHNILGSEVFSFHTLCYHCSVFWPLFSENSSSVEFIFYYVECVLFFYFPYFSSPLLADRLNLSGCFLSFVEPSHILWNFQSFCSLPSSTLTACSCCGNEVDLCGYKPGWNDFMLGEKPEYNE